MSKTIADVASQIAEAVMDAIEKRSGIIKDDIAEAARGVLAKNQSGSSPYLPHMGMWANMFPPPPSKVHIASSEPITHVDCSPGELCRQLAADDGKIWSLPNGSP